MATREDYRECCRAAARDPDALFCPDCARRLFRCAAPDCGSLVAPLGHCAACIAPRLSLEKTAVLKARPGERLSVPFLLANVALKRSLSIKAVLRGDATSQAKEPVPITWEQLDAGRARSFPVAIGPFEHAGLNDLSLAVVVSATLGDAEETYVFAGDVAIDVEGADPTQVNVDLSRASFGTGGMVVTRSDLLPGNKRGREAAAIGARTDIALERAERYEIEHGYRGYPKLAARVPRDVEFVYAGFPANDKPSDGPLLQRPLIRCGRNSRMTDGRPTAETNDLCLRIYDASGHLDRDASTAISRHVCDFVLQDDRLCLRAVSDAGLSLNGEHLARGETRIVNDGDSLVFAAGREKTLSFSATFKVSGSLVTQIRFEKTA